MMRPFILLLFCVTLCCATVMGQSTNASIVGNIINDQNVSLGGATVEVLNESTGFKTSTTICASSGFINGSRHLFIKQMYVNSYSSDASGVHNR